jgi:hypothetical protein
MFSANLFLFCEMGPSYSPHPPSAGRGMGSRSLCLSSIWDQNPKLGPDLCSDRGLFCSGLRH